MLELSSQAHMATQRVMALEQDKIKAQLAWEENAEMVRAEMEEVARKIMELEEERDGAVDEAFRCACVCVGMCLCMVRAEMEEVARKIMELEEERDGGVDEAFRCAYVCVFVCVYVRCVLRCRVWLGKSWILKKREMVQWVRLSGVHMYVCLYGFMYGA
jgi:hypothetical protein